MGSGMTEVHNASDEKSVKKRQDKAKRQAAARDEDFKWLLTQPQFRRWLWHLIHDPERCALMQSPFSPNGSVQTLNLGMQEIARKLYADVTKVNAKLIPQMMLEHAEAEEHA